MNKRNVVISEKAQQDLRDLSNTISLEYMSPLTAIQYLKGIYIEMRKLESTAETFTIQPSNFFRQYGIHVRRVNYKKMAIIYSVVHQTVYIQAIIPSSTIKG